eukprot:c16653_g1_i2 orf=260-1951(-)
MTSAVHTGNHGIVLHDDWQQLEDSTCPVCSERLGTYGGPTSLVCGHKGCVECLQETCSIVAQCPQCQAPFELEMKRGTDTDLEGSLEFEWPGTPKFDDDRGEYGPADSQAKEIKLDCVEQQFRPCAYEEFNTWTPVTYPRQDVQDVVDEAGSTLRSEDKRAIDTVPYRQPHVNTANAASGTLSVCSKSLPLSAEPGCLDASQHLNQDILNTGLDDTWASVHIPTAPPFLGHSQESDDILRCVLNTEPPQWIPDSARSRCMQCHAKFQPLTRGRHHCRFCGGIYCRSCSKGKCLLPLKFMNRDPQRVCDGCYQNLEPIQGFLISMISNAVQIAVHDVTDLTCMRGWLNNPIGLSMQDEIYKATNTLRNFCKVGAIKSEQKIPGAVLRGAKGLAILTVVKVGVVLTYKVGTGLLIARRNDGSWSAPAAIMSCGLGWGLQVGGELVDFIVVLRSTKAVKAFSGRMHVSVGAGLSASVGPLGRLAEADVGVGDKGAAACYTYSCSQGAFVGVSFEGNVVASRVETNSRFYGDMYLTPDYILFGSVAIPKAAAPLYSALHDLFATMGG